MMVGSVGLNQDDYSIVPDPQPWNRGRINVVLKMWMEPSAKAAKPQSSLGHFIG
jgi:hypothetical protein